MFLTQFEGLAVLTVFSLAMIFAVWKFSKSISTNLSSFVLADRDVSAVSGGLSLAVTFIWAPAIFVSAMQSYNDGLPGIFWFTVPNFLCLLLSAIIAPRIRKLHPDGFTFTEYAAKVFGARGWYAHVSLLTINYMWMVLAVVFNATAGGLLLATVSGVPFEITAPAMVVLALGYSIASGLRASVLTDVIQMAVLLLVVLVFVPWTLFSVSDFSLLSKGLGGFDQGMVNPLNWDSFYSVGLLAFIGLWGGWIQDPTFYQRVFALRRPAIRPAFIIAAFAFLVVPVLLSLLGFLGAGLAIDGVSFGEQFDPQMIGPVLIGTYLPKIGLLTFAFMAFAGLCSTLDSAFVATGALTSIDIFKRYINTQATDESALKAGRGSMIVVAVIGLAISFLQPSLLWLFLTISAVAVGGIIPTSFLIFGVRIQPWAVATSVWVSLLISLPAAVYGNLQGNHHVQVGGTLLSLAFSAFVCFLGRNMADDKSTDLG